MKTKRLLRAISLLVLLVSFIPAQTVGALDSTVLPPAELFQLPWDQGLAWMAIDGLDNGTKRPLDSSHQYTVGGAIDFAPRKDMKVGENTSNFWVTAVGAGAVIEKSFCHLKINHGNGWVTEYQFLANVQVKQGDIVYRNQRLGIIANGSSTQKFCPGSQEINIPHLHFMLRPTLRNATFAGWQIGYIPLFNITNFTKNGETLGLYKPLLNVLDLQIVMRGPIAWDTLATGSVDTYRYERWSFTLNETTKFTLTATPATSSLVPLLILMDAGGNEIARGASALTSTQPAGSYFVQVQPQVANGFYGLLLHKEDLPVPTNPYALTVVEPTNVNVGESAVATVSLHNVPAEGYTSAEFTCTYNASLMEANNIVVANLFGADPAVAISGPQNGNFIVAIAGSHGNKATGDGTAFTFSARGLAAGQSPVECAARVSKGDNVLAAIESRGATLTVGAAPEPTATSTSMPTATSTASEPPTPTFTATPQTPPSLTPTDTLTSTPQTSDWLTFTNSTFGFQFKYPSNSQTETGGTDTDTIIHLPFAPGTNLGTKYLQMIVAENANPCQSPLATQSMLEASETVVINGIAFLKQTGQDGTAGHINKWTAYSTSRNNICVSLDFILRAADPGVFATPVPLYDEAAETAVFGQIVSTYAWLALTPTITPTFTITPDESPTPTATLTVTPTLTPVAPTGAVTGKVLAVKPVTVSLFNPDNSLAASGTANPDGAFGFTLSPGAYTITAAAPGFLTVRGSITLGAGDVHSLPTITLLAGDIDNNNVIDQFDAMTVGMSYNTAVPTAADLNNDGVINVLDLELLARNYRASGPVAWE